jgi:ribose 1,5-bisphosphokinase
VLVIGPSGAGKDALMNAACNALTGDSGVVFARRVVTREALAGAEDHDVLTHEGFAQAEAAGEFILSWRAHGLAYGVPASIRRDLDTGRTVVVNVSRAVIEAAEALHYPIAVLHITARPDILGQRIAQRGRESAEDIAARIAREVPVKVHTARLIEIRNESTLEAGAAAFLEALHTVRHFSLDAV